ncbi:queuosine precursor transporter [Vibrio campbellii]|uniref:queuosine precursor transporter n=1 Tax=Vibrio campbellii TaxID=680 RepID=UPI002A18BF01|nr:queuosine precursor transporter [Vibrio campbellii]
MLFFVLFSLLSNIVGIKPILLSFLSFEMIVPSAIFFYPISFILVDILNEFYGLRLARNSILLSTLVNVLFVFLLYLSTLVPSIDSWIGLNIEYGNIINSITSVFFASIISYYVSENINAYTLNKIKELTNSKWLVLRVLVSTTLAAIIDSILFILIAFYSTLPNEVCIQ